MGERTKEQAELERLREYLRMLYRTERHESGSPEQPNAVPYLDSIRGTIDSHIEGQDYQDRLDRWAREILDASIDDLLELPEGQLMRAALRVRYLNEGVSRAAGFEVRVFRSGRLEHMTIMQADELADRAELALVPMVKRKGLPL